MLDSPQKKVLGLIVFTFFCMVIVFNLFVKSEQHFFLLAEAFLKGKTYFVNLPENFGDTIYFGGKYYWPNPPFPAFVMLPFVFVANYWNIPFYQGYIQPYLVFAVYYLIYKIAVHFKYSHKDSMVMAFAFCFASSFLGVGFLSWSWFFSHVISVLLVFLSFFEFFNKKRYSLIGLYFALIFLTRPTAAIGIIFFLTYGVFFSKSKLKEKVHSAFRLIVPILLAVSILAGYNFIRFGQLGDIGYATNTLPVFHDRARQYGIFSPVHIPGNLYYLFLSAPSPVFKDEVSHVLGFPFIENNPWGTGIFFTSPYLIYLFFISYKKKILKSLFTTSLVILIPILLYFGIGFRQFGYRYSLDFLPYLFLSFLIGYKEKHGNISEWMIFTILITGLSNLYLFYAYFLRF